MTRALRLLNNSRLLLSHLGPIAAALYFWRAI